SFAGLVKQNAYEDEVAGTDDTSMGFAGFAAAKFKVSDMISVQGNLNYTDGANAYLYLSGGPDTAPDGTGLESASRLGGTPGTSIGLGSARSINLGHGMTQIDVDADAAEETRSTTLANYMRTPVKNGMMGVEY